MNKLNQLKTAVSGIVALLSAQMGLLAIPVYILILLSTFDYITGLFAAKYRGQNISSDIGLQGIIKKVCLLLLIVLGAVVDWILGYTASMVNISIDINFTVAFFVAIWIICNEIISILENIADIGVPMPPFLLKIAEKLKSETEKSQEENL